jgi:hypothetical protein
MDYHARIIACLKLAYEHYAIPYVNLSNFNWLLGRSKQMNMISICNLD